MVGVGTSHDNKDELAYSFVFLSQPISGNVLPIAPKDAGIFRGHLTLGFDGRNNDADRPITMDSQDISIVRQRLAYHDGVCIHGRLQHPFNRTSINVRTKWADCWV